MLVDSGGHALYILAIKCFNTTFLSVLCHEEPHQIYFFKETLAMPITSLAPNAQPNARQWMPAKNAVRHNPAPMFKGGAPADQFSKADRDVLEHLKTMKKNGVLESLSKLITMVTADPTKSETAKAASVQAPKTFSDIRASIKPEHLELLDKFQECIDKAGHEHTALKGSLDKYDKALQAFKDKHEEDKELSAKVNTFNTEYKDENGQTIAQLRERSSKAQEAQRDFKAAKKSFEDELVLYFDKHKGTLPKDSIEGWQRGFNGNIGWMKHRGIKLLPFQQAHLKAEAQKVKELAAKEAEKAEKQQSGQS